MPLPIRTARPPSRTLLAMGLLAATTLGLQVTLTRHFSFLYWHHFAFMIIGMGMLGFGAAGALLARRGGLADTDDALSVAVPSATGAALAVATYLLVGPHLFFRPLELLSSPDQFFVLALLYGFMLVPFTALGLAQGAILAAYRSHAHRVYAADLIGAGLGCLVTLIVLAVLSAPLALLAWAAAAAVSAALLAVGSPVRRAAPAWVVLAALALGLVSGWADGRPFVPAPSKDMTKLYFEPNGTLREAPDLDYTVSSATIRLDVSKPYEMAFAFGGHIATQPEERAVVARTVYQDAAAPTHLIDLAEPERAAYLGLTNQSLAYQIRERPRVLVIGAGGGPDVLIALHHGASNVTAVELNPQMLELGEERYADFVHGLFQRADVKPIVSEGRHFLGRNTETFDVIQMSGVDTFSALSSGAYAMSESYLYTVEAARAVIGTLEPDGLFTNSRWILQPPRETLRLVAVLAEALRREGIADPARHLFVVQANWWSTTLLSRRPFGEGELEVLRDFVAARHWRVVLDPDGSGKRSFRAVVSGNEATRKAFLDEYLYDVSPVSDDSPFFFQFYRWRNLIEPQETMGGYSITRVPAGYAVLIASLVQMTLLAGICILGPLWSQRSQLHGHAGLAGRFGLFGALGIGFMTIEITSIQMFTVFLGHPIYSMAISLAALLVSTGLGSVWAGRRSATPARIVGSAVVGITLWVGATIALLQPLQDAAIGASLLTRAGIVAAWLLPAGLALGMPFPTAIRALEAETPALVPWAWGTNACLSVIASVTAVLVAMGLGFRATLALAAIVYWLGYLAWRSTVSTVRPPATP